ncbi:hypothetical protein [Kitasatospora purpeofusca]|uniref:hypothetical protein n=1 Tax=Kitasatospora purpeofusca TaxID=67352 RepID=UPI002255E501|nr:hypothetical protein [Kitasatospora purpeofusca]MCX4753847.1 hypothetical protein [Kitasatospora purpeofusca]WSR33320.1 hypothetical protein OG715_21385 [Kitasatospora purpeofusca]WSR41391.1 hypothetical protein OG196_21105 [Kitasatospora purpeofusca]
MDELIFRGRDRYRPSWSQLLILLVLLVAQGFAAAHGLGAKGFLWLAGGTLALSGLGLWVTVRSWSRVGPEGITICWGFGRGRTYPWDRIRWIDVRTVDAQGGTSSQVRMFIANGRRRALPGLLHSDLYPSPDFDEQFHRVRNWWELSTEASARVEPVRRFRDRITVTVAAVLATLVIAAGAAAFIVLRQP